MNFWERRRRNPCFWGLHAGPGRYLNWFLALVPFAVLVSVYLIASDIRLKENPDYKYLPSVMKMAEAVKELVATEDLRTGHYILLQDTLSSLRRLGMGMALAALSALFLGLNQGCFPGFRALLLPFTKFLSIVPPLAILPILLVAFGVHETVKVVLIFIGTAWVMSLDVHLAACKLPKEHITKALTLGASPLGVVYRVVFPQVMPRLIESVRLSLGPAWLFLLAAEAFAASEGLGYRIYLVRRYQAMDVIIPYVLLITFLGFAADWLLRTYMRWKYPWYFVVRES
ncbi:MAG: ABC transporter permease subunit [Candidatus Sungbacteria bacterium]|nr:ABC transporter permease subunit [Candidatus Sungbacteria bacterium]